MVLIGDISLVPLGSGGMRSEQLTLNQRVRGSIPVRPTIFFNDLRASRPDPARGKNCFRSVSGGRAIGKVLST